MMDQEPFRFVIDFAVLAQILANGFTFFPGVGENQTFFAPGMFPCRVRQGIILYIEIT